VEAHPVPLLRDASQRIEGLPAIIKHDFLDNRREVLVQDTTGNVSVVDVTSGRETNFFGRVNFDEKRQELEEQIAVPSWCSVDCKLGSLSVKLDFPQVSSSLAKYMPSVFARARCIRCVCSMHALRMHAPAVILCHLRTPAGVRLRSICA
jgi:hypothetical protein